ncbi:hypothetical protein HA402_011584 [Bradysia odoriphaga]|nr:hypothetical protein HA402_011584 [Bradysia odoriphaga]
MKTYSVDITVILYLAIACTLFCSYWAAPVLFGPVCKGAAIIGHIGYNRYYSMTVLGNEGTLVCCEARGYDGNHKEKWYSIGCDHSS